MTKITLHAGDNRETLRKLIADGVQVHAVVTDPPYGLVSVQKRFGKEGCAPARKEGNDGSFSRLSGGFMGKAWDGTGIERDPEFWKLIYDILLPGGYVFAFSGSRTGHWQACAMEMAGFTMHPMHGWVFGSGFPKAHAADKAIDKHFGADRLDLGQSPNWRESKRNREINGSMEVRGENAGRITAPATPEAAEWEGWAYGTQTQKPALEPIYLGQKPFSEKTGASNILKHGVGAVNIDDCRVSVSENDDIHEKNPNTKGGFGHAGAEVYGKSDGAPKYDASKGRHPSNLILDGSEEVVEMFPTGNERFFHQFPPDCDPVFYHPKANKIDRAGSKHPTVKPVALMQYLIRHITPKGGVVLDPFAGSGTTAQAAALEGFDCVLMEAEPEYVDFLRSRFADHELVAFSEIGADDDIIDIEDDGDIDIDDSDIIIDLDDDLPTGSISTDGLLDDPVDSDASGDIEGRIEEEDAGAQSEFPVSSPSAEEEEDFLILD